MFGGVQRFNPDRGYTAPIKSAPCTSPAFIDSHLHRIGLFTIDGYLTEKRCVNCGKTFDKIYLLSEVKQ